MMRVGNCNGERIGGIRARDLRAGQQSRDHCMDLRLIRAAGADDRLLHKPRRIFADREPDACSTQQRYAPRLTKL